MKDMAWHAGKIESSEQLGLFQAQGPSVFGAPIGDGASCLVCGTATVARFSSDFPSPRVNIRPVGMQTMCRESIRLVSD
jgi:hypothetical protein